MPVGDEPVELVRRFPDMHVAPGCTPTYVEHALVHAIETLPVAYPPGRG